MVAFNAFSAAASFDKTYGELDATTDDFPAANKGTIVVFITSGTVNDVDVKAGQAWRSKTTTVAEVGSNWERSPSHDYPDSGSGTNAEMIASPIWVVNWTNDDLTDSDNFGQWHDAGQGWYQTDTGSSEAALRTAAIDEAVGDALAAVRSYDSVASMLADESLESLPVGTEVSTTSYYAGWAATADGPKGGNSYTIREAENTGIRPDDDGGHILHIGSTARYMQANFDGEIDVLQYGQSNTNGGSAVQFRLAKTAAETLGHTLVVPEGEYRFDAGLAFDVPITMICAGAGRTLFNFQPLSAGTIAVSTGKNGKVKGLYIEGFQIRGNKAISTVGLSAGLIDNEETDYSVTDSHFGDIEIVNFNLALELAYLWTCRFDGMRIQNVNKPWAFNSQVNATTFTNFSAVNYSVAGSFSNCGSVVFDSPNISNMSSNAMTIYQSNVTLMGPYIEKTTGGLATIGGEAESIASELIISGGLVEGDVTLSTSGSTFVAEDFRENTNSLRVKNRYQTSPTVNGRVKVRATGMAKPLLVGSIDKNSTVVAASDGSTSLSTVFVGDYVEITQSTNSLPDQVGITLFTSLSVFKDYTLAYQVRKKADVTGDIYTAIGASSNITEAIPDDSDDWETRFMHFAGRNGSLQLLFTGTIQLRGARLYEGIYNSLDSNDPIESLVKSAAIHDLIASAPEYADDTAAGVGGLIEGDVYVTPAGAVMRKGA